MGLTKEEIRSQIEGLSSLKDSDMETANDMAALLYNMSKCVDKARMKGYDTEEDMEQEAAELQKTNSLLAGNSCLSHYKIISC